MYEDLDLHLSLIINEAWAKRDPKKAYSEYLPETAAVAAQLIRKIRSLERTAKTPDTQKTTSPPPSDDELYILKRHLQNTMKVEKKR